jgi:tetratricopeptide (TPR) repeat protein
VGNVYAWNTAGTLVGADLTRYFETSDEPPEEGELCERLVARVAALSAFEANRIGVSFWRAKDHEKAVTAFRGLLAVHPRLAPAWANLAVNHQALGQRDRAKAAFEKALALDPLNEFARKSFGSFRQEGPAAVPGGEARLTGR